MTWNDGQFQFDSDENGATISVNTAVEVNGVRTYTAPSAVIYQSVDVPGTKAAYAELVRESHRLGVGK
jgi:hypothetical protein